MQDYEIDFIDYDNDTVDPLSEVAVDRMACNIELMHEMQQRDLGREVRELQRFLGLFEEQDKEHESYKTHLAEYQEKLAQLEPRFRMYTEHVEGEIDNLGEITRNSAVRADGEIDGPVYATKDTFWFMDDQTFLAAHTRMENGEPFDWDEKPLSWSRMRHDDEGSEGRIIDYNSMVFNAETLSRDHHYTEFADMGEYDSRERRISSYDLATYRRKAVVKQDANGDAIYPEKEWEFHQNIRIMTTLGGQPKGVPADFKPAEEWDSFETPELMWDGTYTTKKVVMYKKLDTQPYIRHIERRDGELIVTGYTQARARVLRVKCKLMQYLHENSKKLSNEARFGYNTCYCKLEDLNTITQTKKTMVPKVMTDPDGYPVYDESGRPQWKKKKISFLKAGGLHFRGSSQLAPSHGCAYSDNPRYRVVGPGAESIKKRFLDMVRRGHVDRCRKVEMINGKRKVTQQVYAVLPVKLYGRRMHICVFSDVR